MILYLDLMSLDTMAEARKQHALELADCLKAEEAILAARKANRPYTNLTTGRTHFFDA